MRLFNWGNSKVRESGNSLSNIAPVERCLSYQVANLQGIGTRPGQEDSFAFANAMDVTEIKNNGLLALLADGMGGMQDGKKVSELAIAALLEDFRRMDRREDLGRQLKDSVYRIDDMLYRRFGGSGGTTLVACVFFKEKLYFVSVGDSYLYLKRRSGIYRVNREQTYREEMYLQAIEDGLLYPEYVDKDPDVSRLTEFLGSGMLRNVDAFCQPWILQNGDVLLLCSDGVGGVLSEQELSGCLDEPTPEQVCKWMEKEIRKQGRVHQDNYTALVVACKY